MNSVFADTLYWIAVVRPNDPWSAAAKTARQAVSDFQLVTTDEVLVEFLSSLAKGSPALRRAAVSMVRAILDDPQVRVIPQSHAGFMDALSMFENRPDKHYSLTDCRSMNVMRAEGVEIVLSNDKHFVQEGFQVLIERTT